MKRLSPHAHLINMKLNHVVPASVRLLPAKEYRGAAIGINYDVRVYTGKSLYPSLCASLLLFANVAFVHGYTIGPDLYFRLIPLDEKGGTRKQRQNM